MPKASLQDFFTQIHAQFPNLKGYDETRLFAVLMEAGVTVEFEIDAEGQTMITYSDITADSEAKLKQL